MWSDNIIKLDWNYAVLFRVGENTFRRNNKWNKAQRQLMMIKLNTTSSIQFWSWRIKVCDEAFRILLLYMRGILCSAWKTAAGRIKQFTEKVHFLYQKAQFIFYILTIKRSELLFLFFCMRKWKTFHFPLSSDKKYRTNERKTLSSQYFVSQ